MKKTLKNVAILTAMLMIVCAYVAPTRTSAEGNGYLGFDYDGQHQYTTVEEKNTYSSVGMRCDSSENANAYYYARVFGVDNHGEVFDYSHGYEYFFQEGTYHEMLNWVRENDCQEACVRGEGYGIDSEYGTIFTGVWYRSLW